MTRKTATLYVEIRIEAPVNEVWRLTQTAELHSRWDLRFSRIIPQAEASGQPDDSRRTTGSLHSDDGVKNRFRYERRIPFHTIHGTGISIGERDGSNGSRTSALEFSTRDRLSPLTSGRGYWRYLPNDDGSTRFITGYDYQPFAGRAGALLDRIVTRRLIWWMTAFSFDRLRIWAESGTVPESWPVASVAAFWLRDRPRAGRCLSRPPVAS